MRHDKPSHERRRLLLRLVAFVLMLSAASPLSAITVGQVDDFQDGGTQHWSGAGPANEPDSGPGGMGDNSLFVTANGSEHGPGGKLLVYNQAFQWDGNWTEAGVAEVSMDIRNPSQFPLMMRLGIGGPGGFGGGGFGDVHVSTNPISVPPDNDWHSVTFPVLAKDFTTIYEQNGDIDAALADVMHFRILHNPEISFLGAAVVGSFYVDNIQALAGTEELPGDYNLNGEVDAADYVIWRKNVGSPAGYETWTSNFGRSSTNGAHFHGSGLSISPVPEPGTWLLLLVSIALFLGRRTAAQGVR